MISAGVKITILPNKRYPNNPELNEDIQIGNDRFGDFQQCQVIDRNPCENGKVKTGFFYCRIHTSLPLKIDDIVTVEKILYVQRKGNIAVIAITIQESSPVQYEDKICEDEIFGY